MTLTKYNPRRFAPNTFNHFFDRFFSDLDVAPVFNSFSPSVDVAETENSFEIQLSVPGMNKEDFKIDISDDRLTISGERKFEKEDKGKNYRTVESQFGSFSRSFYLPDNVKRDKLSASYTNGILNVTIPKDKKKVLEQNIEVK